MMERKIFTATTTITTTITTTSDSSNFDITAPIFANFVIQASDFHPSIQ